MRLLLLFAALALGKERAPILDPVFYDAVVIGGGPSGVAAAARLANQGRTVMLIERDRRLGREGRACEEPPVRLPDAGAELIEKKYDVEKLSWALPAGEAVNVRLRARAQVVTGGEHLVGIRYQYQGLPRMVRARYAVLAWPGEASVEGLPDRVFFTSAIPGRPVVKGHCAAAEVLRRLRQDWLPEEWPPCGLP